MKIGELARRAEVPVDTVRYYEREGVLPPPLRRDSGYRDYDELDVRRLQFVRRAKRLGFTLPEVRELLGLSDDHAGDMAEVAARAQAKLADIGQRMDELARIRDALQSLLAACPGEGRRDRCPILAALSEHAS